MKNIDDLTAAIRIIRNGGIVIYPTDTAFGIGCRIDSTESVDRLFRIRNRPLTQATPVLVDSLDMALPYLTTVPAIVRRLIASHWPGGLTIVVPCNTSLIYSPIRGGKDSIGIRMPDHADALSLIKGVGIPVLGPSANFHGDPTPYEQNQLHPDLVALVDFVLPGVCTVKQASTVVDCTKDPIHIIRQGAVPL